MNLLVKDRAFYRQLTSIALPIALQNLITFGISLVDTAMVGTLGEAQLSAVSIANQVTFVFQLLSYGTGSGACVLASQYWGRKDVESIQKAMSFMYRIIILSALFFTAMAVFFPWQIIRIFITDAEVIEEGVKYLRICHGIKLRLGVTCNSSVAISA